MDMKLLISISSQKVVLEKKYKKLFDLYRSVLRRTAGERIKLAESNLLEKEAERMLRNSVRTLRIDSKIRSVLDKHIMDSHHYYFHSAAGPNEYHFFKGDMRHRAGRKPDLVVVFE